MSNRIIVYCNKTCCGGTCWAESHVKRLANKHSVPWEMANNDVIKQYGLSLSPTTLFLQFDVVYNTVYGMFMENQIEDKMRDGGVIPPRKPPHPEHPDHPQHPSHPKGKE